VVARLSFLPDSHRLHWHQLAWRTLALTALLAPLKSRLYGAAA